MNLESFLRLASAQKVTDFLWEIPADRLTEFLTTFGKPGYTLRSADSTCATLLYDLADARLTVILHMVDNDRYSGGLIHLRP